jgi:1-acyl-sn-glycerol-3-phosphate acyltransferase
MPDRAPINAGPFEDGLATALLDVVRQTYLDLHRRPAPGIPLTLDSALDRDLGFDSLARVELLLRIERALGVTLPENTLQLAETPRDLLRALRAASSRPGGVPAAVREAPQRIGEAAVAMPAEGATLLEVLAWHLHAHADRTQVVHLGDGGEQRISYAALYGEAAAVAAGLQRHGLEPRQTVAIMLPTSLEYFYVYLGILLAGGIPVPIYPPARLSQIEEHVRRHAGILASAQAAVLVTVREAMAVARLLEASVRSLRQVVTAAALSGEAGAAQPVAVTGEDIAFIQYTSGSTGNPKGVVLTHANLLANIRAMAKTVQATPADVFVSWLPLYHDMGLIGAWLGSLCVGFPLVVMSPLAFLSRPERWLQAIHRHRGTLSAGPNFAYELCARKLDDAQLEGLDLGSWRLAFNGAEAVSPDTIRSFTERFTRFGFRPEAMMPVYGLAECSVGLLFPPLGRAPLVDRIRREPFERHGKALPAAAADANALRFVACGRPLPEHQVRIVDEIGLEAGERVEGRLQFKGPSATAGYHRNPEATRRLFSGDWLDSGDRAYLAEGEVYITGRVKDIIIRGGRNIHPHELEDAVGAVAGVRRGCVAAFGSRDARSGTERLVILAETREAGPAREALRERIASAVLDVLGEPPDEVVLAPPNTVLKTSSGKIRRSAMRELYEAGSIGAGTRAAWWQVARLVARAALPQVRRWLRVGGEIAHAAYVWLVFWLVAPPTWLLTAATRRPAEAWALGGAAARLFLKLCRIPLVVRGLENLPAGSPAVVVANHASYLDGIILVAALPQHYSFVAKRELDEGFISSVYLRRLGAEFVERFAAQQGAEDGQRMVNAVASGRSLAFFPEGTFRRAPGLLPFHLGAFVAAARGRLPVVPVAIRGSRGILRSDGWFPRPGALVVTVGKPIVPPADPPDAFALAVELRDAARAEILRECGEPDAA